MNMTPHDGTHVPLPEIDENTARGKRIRQTENHFGMKCLDTMGMPEPGQRPAKPAATTKDWYSQFDNIHTSR